MNLIDGIIQELQYERISTREVFSRIPENKWDWKPHEKSMSFGRLASHITEMYGWADTILNHDEFVLSTYKPFIATSKSELLEVFDANVDDAIERLTGQENAHLMKTWQMIGDERVLIKSPRIVVLKALMVNHTIHHRGQMSLYLRLADVPLPSIYGPSADEERA